MIKINKYVVMMIVLVMMIFALAGCASNQVNVEIVDDENDSADQSTQTSELQDDEIVLEKDKPIPPYKLTFLDGTSASIDEYKDNVVIIAFFTTWCGYCQKELPILEKLQNEIKDFKVIGIDVQEGADKVADFVEQMGITFPVYCDESGQMKEIFYVNGYPTLAVVTPEGIFLGTLPGYVKEEDLIKAIDYSRDYKPGSSSN